MRGSGGGRPGTPEPAQRRLAPPQSRHRPLHVTRRGHVSSALGAMAPSPGGSRQLVLPEVTSPPPGAASDPTGSGGRKPEGPVVWRRGDLEAAVTMGRQFGHLTRVRHVIIYSLSPFEQRAFPHYFSKGIPNVLRRTRACILRVAPPFVAFYLVYTWGTQEFEKSKRKNPAAYENDK